MSNDTNSAGVHTGNKMKPPFKERDGILWTAYFIFSGFGAILFVAIVKGAFFPVLGLSLMVALCCLFTGGFMGFLFGIPKVLQNANAHANAGASGTDTGQEIIVSNTNLEQISDWLTKIIVGISLTQMPALRNEFAAIAGNLSKGFSKNLNDPAFSYSYACALIIFFITCGFLLLYLWARTHLLVQLDNIRRLLLPEAINDLNRKMTDLGANIVKAMTLGGRITELKNKLAEFEQQKKSILQAESRDDAKTAIETAQPTATTILYDGNKNRWGGKNEDGVYALDASFNFLPASGNYEVTLLLSAKDPASNPITGSVYFLLHSSYSDPLVIVPANDNTATYSFQSGEAFTVAAVFNNGNNKLELDLNEYPKTPKAYRYVEKLFTETEMKTELDKLEQDLQAIDCNKSIPVIPQRTEFSLRDLF